MQCKVLIVRHIAGFWAPHSLSWHCEGVRAWQMLHEWYWLQSCTFEKAGPKQME